MFHLLLSIEMSKKKEIREHEKLSNQVSQHKSAIDVDALKHVRLWIRSFSDYSSNPVGEVTDICKGQVLIRIIVASSL